MRTLKWWFQLGRSDAQRGYLETGLRGRYRLAYGLGFFFGERFGS